MLGEVFNELLTTYGVESRHDRYVTEGLEFFKKNYERIAGVILDVKIPHSKCKDVLLELKKIDKEVKVLLTTGYGHTKEVDELLGLGAKSRFKPFQNTFEDAISIIETEFDDNH